MWKYLKQHPEIFFPMKKEQGFFVGEKKLKEYLEQYEGRKEPILGDASTTYIYDNEALKKINFMCPNAKIIILRRKKKDAIESYLWSKNKKAGIGITKKQAEKKFEFDKRIKYCRKIFGKNNVYVVQIEKFKTKPLKEYEKLLTWIGVKKTNYQLKFRLYNVRSKQKFKWLYQLMHKPFLRKIGKHMPFFIRKQFGKLEMKLKKISRVHKEREKTKES